MLDTFFLHATTACLNAIPPTDMVPLEDFTAVVEDLSERSTLDTIADMPEFFNFEQGCHYNHLYETGCLQKALFANDKRVRFENVANTTVRRNRSTAKELSARHPLWAHPKRHQEEVEREAKRVKLALRAITKATIAQLTPATTPQVGYIHANLVDVHDRQCSSPDSCTFTFTAPTTLTTTNLPPILNPTTSTNTIVWDPSITSLLASEHQIILTPAQIAHDQKRSFEAMLGAGPFETMHECGPLEMTDEIFAGWLKSELAKTDAQTQY